MQFRANPEANMLNIQNSPGLPQISVGKDGLPTDLPDEAVIGRDGNPIESPDVVGTDGNPVAEEDDIERITMHSSESDVEHPSDEESEEEKPIGFFASVMNLLNSMLGAGILSVPSCFCDTGITGTIAIIVIIAALSYVATYMVVVVQSRLKVQGFSELAYRCTGKIGSIILVITQLLFLVSAMLAYLIIGGDMILSWFKLGGIDLSGFWLRALVVGVYSMCIPIALTIPRNIGFLKFFSTATVVFILFYCCVMIYKGSDYIMSNGGINPTCINFNFDMKALNSISIASLTFALPCVCLPTFKLYYKDVSKRNLVALTTILLCTTVVLLPSIFGYFIFGKDTNGNVLNSYPDDDYLIVVTRGVFFFVVSFAYPMVAQSAISSYSSMIYKVDGASGLSFGRRSVVLLLTNGIPLIIAMLLGNAKPVLAIGGAIGGCIANYTFPALMYFLTSEGRWFHPINILSITFSVFGGVVGLLSTYQAVIAAIDSFK